jgi:hypothetical protein
MVKQKTRYATRIYGREDGLEYDGDIYPTLKQALKGARAQIAEMKRHGQCVGGADYQVLEWHDAYGEIVAGSDI